MARVAHAVGAEQARLGHRSHDLTTRAHAEAVHGRAVRAAPLDERVVGGPEARRERGIAAVAAAVDQLLGMLDAHAELERLRAARRRPGPPARAACRARCAPARARPRRRAARPPTSARRGSGARRRRRSTSDSSRVPKWKRTPAPRAARAAAAARGAGGRCRCARARPRRSPRALRRRRAPRRSALRARGAVRV